MQSTWVRRRPDQIRKKKKQQQMAKRNSYNMGCPPVRGSSRTSEFSRVRK